MRVIVITLVILAALAAAAIGLYVQTVTALNRGVHDLWHELGAMRDSTKFEEEHLDTWPPITYGSDTVGKLVAVARVVHRRTAASDSFLIYRGVLTGRPPRYQPDSLVAIDSADDTRFPHELRLIPLHALTPRQQLGSLKIDGANESILVMAAVRHAGPP